ncbi:MAG: hypothetical protein AAFZ07_04060 [Actinomycetota bacterium]
MTDDQTLLPHNVDVVVCFCAPDLPYSYVEAKLLYDAYRPKRMYCFNTLYGFLRRDDYYSGYPFVYELTASDESVLVWFATHGTSDGKILLPKHNMPRFPNLGPSAPTVTEWSFHTSVFLHSCVTMIKHFDMACRLTWCLNICMSSAALSSMYTTLEDLVMTVPSSDHAVDLDVLAYGDSIPIPDRHNLLFLALRSRARDDDRSTVREFAEAITRVGRSGHTEKDVERLAAYLARARFLTKEDTLRARIVEPLHTSAEQSIVKRSYTY